MSEDELCAAVEQPALGAGRTFEAGQVERILAAVIGQPGDLSLLEFALTELWTRLAADDTLTHAGHEAIGQVAGAIAQRAEAEYNALAIQAQRYEDAKT